MRVNGSFEIADEALGAFCSKWKVRELALFGSVLGAGFHPDSDVDILVTFEDDAGWDLYDMVQMRDELAGTLGRKVDLVERAAVEESHNPFRKHGILSGARVIYKNEAA